ncbi:hypothetical protein Ga0100230_020270 [Opitutaceae bacterium TAV3]|nr:hypothetical protein Ga0100230_020270 [Opitutaceae bacterium TAV3]
MRGGPEGIEVERCVDDEGFADLRSGVEVPVRRDADEGGGGGGGGAIDLTRFKSIEGDVF